MKQQCTYCPLMAESGFIDENNESKWYCYEHLKYDRTTDKPQIILRPRTGTSVAAIGIKHDPRGFEDENKEYMRYLLNEFKDKGRIMIDAFSAVSKKNGKSYYLHSKEVTLKRGHVQRIYYFAGEIDEEFVLKQLPQGYEVMENTRTGLPMLKKIV